MLCGNTAAQRCCRGNPTKVVVKATAGMQPVVPEKSYKQQQQQWRSVLAAVAAVPLLLLSPSVPPSWAAAVPAVHDPASNLGFLTNEEVEQRRKQAHFVRAYDGHVSLQNKLTQAWTDIKCDLKVPGLLLFRDAGGQVSYLSYAGLQQVDLSDDQVVAAVAKDNWEAEVTAVQTVVAGGRVEPLQLTREGFYQLVSISSTEDFGAAAGQRQPPRGR